MIVSVPSPPVLLPGLTGRPVAEVEELRVACLTAIRAMLASEPDDVVVVGAATPLWSGGIPLTELIGRTLLGEAGCAVPVRYSAIDPMAEPAKCHALGQSLSGAALLVVADGSARRGLKAPGYLDERAAPFDQQLLAALASGDPAELAAIDAGVAAELMVAGRAAWQVMAGATAGRTWQTETLYADDPFGVFYPIVVWR